MMWRIYVHNFTLLHALDNDVVELSEDELADLTEGNVTASEMAIYIPNDGQINANHYTKALFSLQQRRISRYFNTNVTDNSALWLLSNRFISR